jgi:hypothetical protein
MVLQDGQSTPKLAAINFLIEAEPALQLQIEVTQIGVRAWQERSKGREYFWPQVASKICNSELFSLHISDTSQTLTVNSAVFPPGCSFGASCGRLAYGTFMNIGFSPLCSIHVKGSK